MLHQPPTRDGASREPGQSSDAAPDGWISRAAARAARAWPGCVLVWFAVALEQSARVVWSHGGLPSSPLSHVFAAGCLALALLPLFAGLVLLGALAGAPGASGAAALPAPVPVRRLVLGGVLAAALGYPAVHWAVRLAWPTALAFPERFAYVVGVYGSVLCGVVAAALLWARAGLGGRTFPWAGAVPFVLLARLATQQTVEEIARARVLELEVGLLALLVALSSALPLSARTRPALRVLSLLMLGSLATLLGAAAQRPGARGALADDFVAASGLLYRAAALWDLDGDGFPSLLLEADCNDGDPAVHPAALERVGNGIDDNCVGGDLPRATLPRPAVPSVGAPRRSLVMISIDALRADMLPASPARGRALPMPELTRFARAGVQFTRAYAQASFTNDSLRAVMTGDYPMSFRHGEQDLGSEPHLASLLQQQGYRTLAQSAHADMRKGWLLFVGFQTVDERIADHNAGFSGVTSELLTDHAIAHFDRLRGAGQPFVQWVHYLDPHLHHMPHAGTPFEGADERARYLREVWHTDRHLGRLLRHLEATGFLEDNVVVVFSDHGEQLGEHGRTGHSYWLSEATLRVPLLLRGAGLPAAVRDTRVRLVDLYPTLLRLSAGLVARTGGEDLAGVIEGRERADRPVLARTHYKALQKRALLDGQWKLVEDERAGGLELYDLGRDPQELHNLVDAQPERWHAMRQRLGRLWDLAQNDVLLNQRGRARVERDCRAGVQAACAYLRAHP